MQIKIIITLVIVCLLLAGYAYMDIQAPTKADVVSYNSLNPQEQEELNKYRKEELARRQRQAELDKLQNPTVLMQKLAKKGKLLVYSGEVEHRDFINEDGFWGDRSINLNLIYNFGISYDLKEIEISSVGDSLEVKLDNKQLKLEFVELVNDSNLSSNTTWFAGNFTPEETSSILYNADSKTMDKIMADKDIFYQARLSLEENIRQLLEKMGCVKKVEFSR